MALAGVALASALGLDSTARADSPETHLSEQKAVRLAILHNPDTRSAGYGVKAAEGGLVQSRLLPNPGVFVGALGRAVAPVQGPVPNTIGVTWDVPIGGKREAGIAAAKATLDAAKASYVNNRRQLELSVETAFVTALLDESLLAFAQADRDQFYQELDLNELRYRDGKIAYGDVLKLKVQALGLDDALRQAQEALKGARADLEQLVGEGVLAPDFVLDGELTAPPDREVTAEGIADQALIHRADYRAALAQQDSADASLKLARRTPIPDLGVSVDYDHDFLPNNPNPAPYNYDAYDVILSVPIPVLDQNQGNIAQAAAAFEQARLAVESLRLSIHDAAVKAVAEWNASRAQLAAYTAGKNLAGRSLEISKHAYEVGSGTLLDYLDAQSSYRQVESAWRTALARTVVADRNLRFAAGEELP